MRSTQAAVTSREESARERMRSAASQRESSAGEVIAARLPPGLARAPSPVPGREASPAPAPAFGLGPGGRRGRGEPAQRRRHLGRLGVEAGPVGEGCEGRLRVGEEAGHALRVAVVELRVLGRADELREGRGAHLGRLVHGWPALGSKVRQAYPIAPGAGYSARQRRCDRNTPARPGPASGGVTATVRRDGLMFGFMSRGVARSSIWDYLPPAIPPRPATPHMSRSRDSTTSSSKRPQSRMVRWRMLQAISVRVCCPGRCTFFT